jgi:hypothetical protein
MPYHVIKTVGGRQYRYLQRSYRDGGRVRTKSIYLGPVDATRRKRGLLREMIDELVRKPAWRESERDLQERLARETAERAVVDRNNELLTAPSITLDAIQEIAASQAEQSAAPGDACESE